MRHEQTAYREASPENSAKIANRSQSSTRRSALHTGAWSAGVLALVCGLSRAEAGSYDGEDFSLRLPAALSQFSPYGDVAGVGGASVGSPFSSSINPASAAWLKMTGPCHLAFCPQYSGLVFDNGSRMNVFAETLQWDAQQWGVFQFSAAQERSNQAAARNGLDFGFDLNAAQLMWAKKLSDTWAVGAGFTYNGSRTAFNVGDAPFAFTGGRSYGGRVGALTQLADHLLAGVAFDYNQGPADTTYYDTFGTGMGDFVMNDRGFQTLLRTGLSYEYMKDSRVYFDYQYGTFWNTTGSLTLNHFALGVEQGIVKGVFLRGGTAVDTCGNVALTGGVGFYPTDRFSVDLAYQYNMFPELIPDLGRANSVTAALTIQF